MRDSLKEHIDHAREDFELYPFDSDQEWSKLSSKISPKGKVRSWKWSGIAASIVLLISCSIFFYNSSNTEHSEIVELESYYDGAINQKITLIKSQLKDDRILQDVEEMNAAFSELKADLKDNVDNEEVVTAMMENYRLKLQILEEILKELEKERSEEVL